MSARSRSTWTRAPLPPADLPLNAAQLPAPGEGPTWSPPRVVGVPGPNRPQRDTLIGRRPDSVTSASPDRHSPGLRSVLAQPDYRRLWAARTVSQWGDTFSFVALASLIYRLTGSAPGVVGVFSPRSCRSCCSARLPEHRWTGCPASASWSAPTSPSRSGSSSRSGTTRRSLSTPSPLGGRPPPSSFPGRLLGAARTGPRRGAGRGELRDMEALRTQGGNDTPQQAVARRCCRVQANRTRRRWLSRLRKP